MAVGMFGPAIPPELFEVLNTAVAAVCFVVCCYCGFYFLTEYRDMRSGLSLTLLEALRELLNRRLAVGTMIAFFGVGTRAAWVSAGRIFEALGFDASPMGKMPLVFFPIASTLILILGGACVARAITPRLLGRYAYLVTFGAVLFAIVATQAWR